MEKLFCPYCGGRLIKKVVQGCERFFCPQCQLPIYENPVPATAAIVTNDAGEVLLVQRAVDPHQGKWCLPGGFMEIDETPEECVLRELREETALGGEIDHFLGIEMSHNVLYRSVLVMAYVLRAVRGQPRPGDDALDLGYFSFDRLPDIAFASHRRFLELTLGERQVKLPSRLGAYLVSSGDHVRMAEAACRAGARILQYRDKRAAAGEKLLTCRRLRQVTRASGTLFFVNDQIDLAILAEADGVHLGQEDIPIGEARRIVPGRFLIGVSTHSLDQALTAQEQGADYIGVGPVFATPTKKDYPAIGLETVRQMLERVTIPVVAIGGITLRNLPQLKAIGVQNAAMVREFQCDPAAVVCQANAILLADSA